jgi:hypothetical protein
MSDIVNLSNSVALSIDASAGSIVIARNTNTAVRL